MPQLLKNLPLILFGGIFSTLPLLIFVAFITSSSYVGLSGKITALVYLAFAVILGLFSLTWWSKWVVNPISIKYIMPSMFMP